MKKKIILGVLPFFMWGQQQQMTLEKIWKGAFKQSYLRSFRAMEGGFYSLLNWQKSTTIDKYRYKDLKKIATLFDSKNFPQMDAFDDYFFSKDETKVLLKTKTQYIYRHSTKAIYFLYDFKTQKLQKISEHFIAEPTLDPHSKKIAYVYKNNLFIKDLEKNTTLQITKDGVKNKIINGTTDWVYEEEFGFVKAFAWNSEATKIAYLKFDESKVPVFSMDLMGKGLYPSQEVFKYPKAGAPNANVFLYIYDVKTQKHNPVNLGNYEYLPQIQWTRKANILSIITMNRHQNHLKMFFVNAKNNKAKIILEEKDAAYVELNNHLTFLKDNSFLWTSEKDGYNHLYHYDSEGKLKKQITKGTWEITNFYGYNPKNKKIYYQSTETGSIYRAIYSIKISGKNKKRLTKKYGNNRAAFSKDKKYCILTYSDAKTPNTYILYKNDKPYKEIKNNQKLLEKLKKYKVVYKEFSTIKINGESLNMWMLKPHNFNKNKKYPLLMYQYSGPGSQNVSDHWFSSNDYWYQILLKKGYIIICVDGRGTGFKGAKFKKMTYKQLGKYEVQDQIAVAKKMGQLPYIDEKRIAIWGWSYGGFMASNCILQGADVFSTAIAVAPVTSWRYYDSIYTERYMQTPQENPNGYDANSPITHAQKLKGNFLLIHGSGDDNVHMQNTYQMINVLVKNNKQFEHFIYPDRTHGIYEGKNTRLHLYTKMTNFLDKHLLNIK